ncbi:MAG: DUF1559 domain-containing protein [Pirellulales bacterium]
MTKSRRAFTLVEMLVVITIIGMLLAMMFPALQSVLAAARRQQCVNNLRELAHAAEASPRGGDDRYPSLVERGASLPGGKRGQPITWAAALLEFVGHKPLGDTWTRPRANKAYVVARVAAYICSEDPTADGDQALSYVINAGAIEDAEEPNLANGVAFSRYLPRGKGVSRSEISAKKSLAATILFSENLQAGNWADRRERADDAPRAFDGDPPTSARQAQQFTGFVFNGLAINAGDYDRGGQEGEFDGPSVAPSPKWARPSSHHPAGVNVAMCGGSVRFMHQGIDRHVFQYLCVTNPEKAAAAGLDHRVGTMVTEGDW